VLPNPEWHVDLPEGRAQVSFTVRSDGDFAVGDPDGLLAERRVRYLDRPWVGLTQVHGAGVVVIDHAPADTVEADALVTTTPDLVLSVNVADCAPIALVSRQGIVAAVHAGWRGSAAGVVEATADAMRSLGAIDIRAWLGPCIHPECYEFGSDDLDELVARFGPAVRSRTAAGTAALDLPMVVARALGRSGIALADAADACTACDGNRFFSHRARQDAGRHALAVWIDPAGS
jgi:YfiH family protein